MIHYLKTWPEPFLEVTGGKKHFEVRKSDRAFREGDHLHLLEWMPETEQYTGKVCIVRVTHILQGGQFGIEPGYCVMSIVHWPELPF